MALERLALFTTVYPAVTRFLPEWTRSVAAQTDTAFDLWIGLDGMLPDEVAGLIAGLPQPPRWIVGQVGGSPGAIRGQAMARLTNEYDAVVFVDSDDLLSPERVEAARAALLRWDVAGCALQIMDEEARDLGLRFGPLAGTDPCALLPKYNVFGLSNTGYRSAALRRCLPVPRDCVLVDWLLATRAWLNEARLGFDPEPRMWYRQYGANTAQVVGRFTAPDVLRATELVLDHYQLMLTDRPAGANGGWQNLAEAQAVAQQFHRAITASAEVLERYVEAINDQPRRYFWWWCVAHPELEAVWRS